jgi:membrane associated rhomboid family serine protease
VILPIGIDSSIRRYPYVTFALIALCVVAYLAQGRMPDFTAFANDPDGLVNAVKALRDWAPFKFGYPGNAGPVTMLTYMFLHGGFWHLVGNMLLLYFVGVKLEDTWGHVVVLGLYLLGGVIAAVFYGNLGGSPAPELLQLLGIQRIPMVGASGAVAALMGAFLLRLYNVQLTYGFFLLPLRPVFTFRSSALVAFPIWLAIQVVAYLTGSSGQVATIAHIGGFAFGVVVAALIRLTPLDRALIHADQAQDDRERAKGASASSRAMKLLNDGKYAEARQLLQTHLQKSAEDTEAWETYWDLMRVTQQDPTFAIVQTARAYAQTGDRGHAKRLLTQNKVEPTLREALQLARAFDDADGDAMLLEALKRHPADPMAPKASITLIQRRRSPELEETLRMVLMQTTDLEWREQLERALKSA